MLIVAQITMKKSFMKLATGVDFTKILCTLCLAIAT